MAKTKQQLQNEIAAAQYELNTIQSQCDNVNIEVFGYNQTQKLVELNNLNMKKNVLEKHLAALTSKLDKMNDF